MKRTMHTAVSYPLKIPEIFPLEENHLDVLLQVVLSTKQNLPVPLIYYQFEERERKMY